MPPLVVPVAEIVTPLEFVIAPEPIVASVIEPPEPALPLAEIVVGVLKAILPLVPNKDIDPPEIPLALIDEVPQQPPSSGTVTDTAERTIFPPCPEASSPEAFYGLMPNSWGWTKSM